MDLDFTKKNYKEEGDFRGWISRNTPDSLNISAIEKGWEWEYDTLPLDRVLDPSLTDAGILSQYSVWNQTSCTNPVTNQYYLAGPNAHFQQDVTVKVTDRMTVEFWFRPDVANIRPQDETVLFMMS